MTRLVIALVVFLLSASVAAAKEDEACDAFKVHGRLSLYNGNPGFRIWVVGTKRVLGVAETPPEEPLIPPKLFELALGDNRIFGDFTVVPLTKDEPGVMRRVRVIRAENLVITDGRLNVIRRIGTSIQEEAIQSPEPMSVLRTAMAHR